LHFAKEKDLTPVIASITGLIRGFVVPSSQCKRTSPMLIEDFVDELGNGNFDQFGQAGERDTSSFFLFYYLIFIYYQHCLSKYPAKGVC
jgi:hypothetical protein